MKQVQGGTALRELEVLVFDCQATTSSVKSGHLFDIAWCRTSAARDEHDIETTLVRLPDEMVLPRRVAQLTGICSEELQGAPERDEVAVRLRERLDGWESAPAVAHWARYEKAFVEDLLAASPFDWICTHNIAKRLVPGLPRKGLRAVAGYFGRTVDEAKRAAEHVDASIFVWRQVVEELAAEGVETFDDLGQWLEKPAKKVDSRTYPLPRDTRLALPGSPGVYRMLGRDGTVLYVGKATSLKDRVNSYFRQRRLAEDKMELISQVWDLDVTVTESALEASLLETDEIKRLAPRYNHKLRRRGRSLAWASPDDLRDVALEQDPAHSLGPFSSVGACAHFADIFDLLTGRGVPTWLEETEPELIVEGLAIFRERWGNMPDDVDAFLALGGRIFAETADLAEEPDEEEERTGELTAETVARILEGGASAAYRAVQRGVLLRSMTKSRIRWAPHGRPDELRELEVAEPMIDVDGYDRLSVLLVELRRILRDGREVSLVTGECTYDSESLAARLRDF